MGMPVMRPGPITCEESVGDLIESIAMQERSIAHILNAESEKIQLIVGLPATTPQQLLAVNRSVKTTVDALTRLESTLLAKLDLCSGVICKTN